MIRIKIKNPIYESDFSYYIQIFLINSEKLHNYLFDESLPRGFH